MKEYEGGYSIDNRMIDRYRRAQLSVFRLAFNDQHDMMHDGLESKSQSTKSKLCSVLSIEIHVCLVRYAL